MKPRLSYTIVVVCALAIPAAAAENTEQSGPAAGGVILSVPQGGVVKPEKKPELNLSNQQQQAVIDAIVERKSHQATPKEFKGEVGATVSPKVDIHAMPPRIVSELPELKQYMYAHLDREIAIVDAHEKKVVALIPLPANLAQDSKPAATTGQSVDRKVGSGTPTADPLREREETGKESAYTGPSTTGPNTDGGK
jgi:hypothetical protein